MHCNHHLHQGGDIVQMELSYPEIAAAASQVMRPQSKPTFVSGNWSPVQNGTQSLILTGLLIVRVGLAGATAEPDLGESHRL